MMYVCILCLPAADTTANGDSESDKQPRHDTSAASPDSPYQDLHRQLRKLNENEDGDMWSTEDERNRKTKKIVTDFFEACKLGRLKLNDVSAQIEVLYKNEEYITREVYSWACEYLDEMNAVQENTATASDECAKQDVPTPKEPLFSQENLYHALLCCKALESSDELKVVAALEEHGHLFEQLSVTQK